MPPVEKKFDYIEEVVSKDISAAIMAEISEARASSPSAFTIGGSTVGRSFTIRKKGTDRWHTAAVYGELKLEGVRIGKRAVKGKKSFLFVFSTEILNKEGNYETYEVESPFSGCCKKLGLEFDTMIHTLLGVPFSEFVETQKENNSAVEGSRIVHGKVNISDVKRQEQLDIVGWGRWG